MSGQGSSSSDEEQFESEFQTKVLIHDSPKLDKHSKVRKENENVSSSSKKFEINPAYSLTDSDECGKEDRDNKITFFGVYGAPNEPCIAFGKSTQKLNENIENENLIDQATSLGKQDFCMQSELNDEKTVLLHTSEKTSKKRIGTFRKIVEYFFVHNASKILPSSNKSRDSKESSALPALKLPNLKKLLLTESEISTSEAVLTDSRVNIIDSSTGARPKVMSPAGASMVVVKSVVKSTKSKPSKPVLDDSQVNLNKPSTSTGARPKVRSSSAGSSSAVKSNKPFPEFSKYDLTEADFDLLSRKRKSKSSKSKRKSHRKSKSPKPLRKTKEKGLLSSEGILSESKENPSKVRLSTKKCTKAISGEVKELDAIHSTSPTKENIEKSKSSISASFEESDDYLTGPIKWLTPRTFKTFYMRLSYPTLLQIMRGPLSIECYRFYKNIKEFTKSLRRTLRDVLHDINELEKILGIKVLGAYLPLPSELIDPDTEELTKEYVLVEFYNELVQRINTVRAWTQDLYNWCCLKTTDLSFIADTMESIREAHRQCYTLYRTIQTYFGERDIPMYVRGILYFGDTYRLVHVEVHLRTLVYHLDQLCNRIQGGFRSQGTLDRISEKSEFELSPDESDCEWEI